MNGDPFETGVPKYATAASIYDALCELTQSEEMSILSEMFADVSYDGQDYYYTDKGTVLKEQFEEISDYGNKMWVMDLAVFQIGQDNTEIHDIVFEALNNLDLAKRIGFKKLFIDKMLHGDKLYYDEIAEAYFAELGELNRFENWEMIKAFNRVMQERGTPLVVTPYPGFCHALYEKVSGLHLQKEMQLIAECRALLTSYDDFILGLRMNQTLHTRLEQNYQSKIVQLQASYKAAVQQLLQIAEKQGVDLTLIETLKMLPE